MQATIIGRERQIKEMDAALQSNRPEMVALIGRRRIGKTFLVRQLYSERIDFELTGLQHGKQAEQLQNFTLSLGKYFPDFAFKKMPSNWLEAFFILGEALESLPKTEKKVIFLDEVPWMGTKRSGFITGLGYFWNSWASKHNIVVVICGSAASWMIKKIIDDKGGLHNRVTRLLFLYPFTLAETEAYCQAKNIRLNRYQLLQLYMIMGGVPMYLDLLKPGLSAVQNIQQACFEDGAYLRNEFERLYQSLFDNYENHVKIIRALAERQQGLSRDQIAQVAKMHNGGVLTEYLDELEKSGFITIYGGYGKKVKDSLYRLSDFYSYFYLTFLEPLGKSSKIDFTKLSDLPKWKTWSDYAYENVCLAHIDQIRKALGISGMASSVASFLAKPKDGLPGTQIDLLIDRSDQSINLCEIKFCAEKYVVSKADVENFQQKKMVFRYHAKTKKHLFLTLITTYGAVDNEHRLGEVDQVLELGDLFVR
jgi:uncharacterized protein